MSDQVWIKPLFFIGGSLQKWIAHFYCSKTYKLEKQHYLPHYWSDQGFKRIVVDRAMPSLHGGSFEIMLTVTLRNKNSLLLPDSFLVLIKVRCQE